MNAKQKAKPTDKACHPCQQEQTEIRSSFVEGQSLVKVNFGNIVSDARGKIGGTVFARNSSGAYARQKVTPVNVRSQSQKDVRSNFGTFAKQWSSLLTQTERTAWNLFATQWPRNDIFGNSITISGMNMYISLNARLTQAGVAIMTSPPADLSVTPVAVGTFNAATGGQFTFDQTALAPAAGNKFYVFGTAGLAAGRKVTPSDYRFIASAVAVITGTMPVTVDMSTEWDAIFPNAQTGQNVFARIATLNVNNGALSVGVPFSIAV